MFTEFFTTSIWSSLSEAALDSIESLPFLVAAFLLMEYVERRSEGAVGRLFRQLGGIGPLAGAALGLIPQCGFAAAISNLYAAGIVSLGTLIAVFLATSDEALIVMLLSPGAGGEVLRLLLAKFFIALVFGLLLDFVFRTRRHELRIDDICTCCGCDEEEGILLPALRHTLNVFIWLIVISFVLNLLLDSFGSERLALLMGSAAPIQPFIAAAVGLIPNCAVSVLIARLYIAGTLSFASAVAGLSSGAGLGLIVLFRLTKDKKEALLVTILLYILSASSGFILAVL